MSLAQDGSQFSHGQVCLWSKHSLKSDSFALSICSVISDVAVNLADIAIARLPAMLHAPPLTVKVTDKPDEAVALAVNGGSPYVLSASGLKVII